MLFRSIGFFQHHAGMPLYDWLLEKANTLGIPGGSAFRAIAGYGRHGKLHEETFFELAGEMAVKVEFIVDEQYAEKFLDMLHAENQKIFYVRHTVQSGVI